MTSTTKRVRTIEQTSMKIRNFRLPGTTSTGSFLGRGATKLPHAASTAHINDETLECPLSVTIHSLNTSISASNSVKGRR